MTHLGIVQGCSYVVMESETGAELDLHTGLPYWLFSILAFFKSLWLGKFEFGFFLKFGLLLAFLKFVFSFQKFHCLGVYGRNNAPCLQIRPFLDATFNSTTQEDSKNLLVWACVAKKANDVMHS